MLEFIEITKTFSSDLLKKPFKAVDNLSFKIESGKTIGFLGANGAGKTTSIKMAMDFIRPTSGQIVYHEALGKNRSQVFSNIGYLPERPFFYPHLTGRDFCCYTGRLVGLSDSVIKDKIQFWGPKFKIDFALDREIKTYSKGMLQRTGFLSTLLHDPKLIVLDEPLAGVDPIGRKELKDIIEQISGEGKTVFFSSHIVSDVEEVCDHVLFIKDGKLLFSGSVDQVIKDNIKPESQIKYLRNGEVKKDCVPDLEKMQFLGNLVKNDYEVLSVEPQKLTLEQIFYNVK